MARSATELRRLHMLHRPIGNLSSDQNVEKPRDTKEPGKATQRNLAIEGGLSQSFADLPLAEINPDRNQHQPSEENQWKDEEDDDANVRVIDVAANL